MVIDKYSKGDDRPKAATAPSRGFSFIVSARAEKVREGSPGEF